MITTRRIKRGSKEEKKKEKEPSAIKPYETMDKWSKDSDYWNHIFKGINFKEIIPETNKWQDLQYISGFDLPDSINYFLINPDSIFQRLYYLLGTSNIIAVSEFIKLAKEKKGEVQENYDLSKKINEMIPNINIKDEEKPQIKIFGCIDDTGFINKITYNKLDKEVINGRLAGNNLETFTDTSIFQYGTLQIASIHFDSNGPKGRYEHTKTVNDEYDEVTTYTPSKTYTDTDIPNFIKYQFDTKYSTNQFKKNQVNIICGDTNITVLKSGADNRDTLGKKIAEGLNKYFLIEYRFGSAPYMFEWLVLMSSHKINKNRRGFILKNQQIHKSVSKEYKDDIDADGTILAIKIAVSERIYIIQNWKNIFNEDLTADEFVIYSADEVYPIKKDNPISSSEAFSFNTIPEKSVDNKNKPIEKVFIDHSVLYSNLNFLTNNVDRKIIGTEEDPNLKKNHLIVLNLNSMVNSGTKKWNLKVRDYLHTIIKLDKIVYASLKGQMFLKSSDGNYSPYNNDYEQFNGTNKELYYKVLSEGEYTPLNEAVKAAFAAVKLLLATKYLKKGYYEKYIKYKTKYMNLKNT